MIIIWQDRSRYSPGEFSCSFACEHYCGVCISHVETREPAREQVANGGDEVRKRRWEGG